MTPAECPRCKRPAKEWTVERHRGVAGCPCGEVVAISFEDEEPSHLGDAVSTTPRKPPQWSEAALGNGWRGTFAPNLPLRSWAASGAALLAWLLACVAFPFLPQRGALFLIVATSAMTLPLLGLVTAFPHFVRGRSLSLSFEDGRFRADAWRMTCDVSLEEILGFGVGPASGSPHPLGQNVRGLNPAFDLCVYCENGKKIRVPLFGGSADEVQFISDRANEILAAGGHKIGGGYRGERVRIDVGTAPPEEIANDAPEADDAETRARRL